jgi:hypothetical protein
MGMIDFVKEAGEKLFGRGKAQAAMAEAKTDPANEAKSAAAVQRQAMPSSATSNPKTSLRQD